MVGIPMQGLVSHIPVVIAYILYMLCVMGGIIFCLECLLYSFLGLLNWKHAQFKEWLRVLFRGAIGSGLLYIAYLLAAQTFTGG